MSVQPGACRAGREAGTRAGRRRAGRCKQRHQAQEHIRALGGNIWSALEPPPQQAGTHHGTNAALQARMCPWLGNAA